MPGELFVVRNVAALVPPYEPDARYHGTSAALEFGVKVLKVARLVVLGHGQCGGVKAMAYGPPPQARDFIASWVEIGRPALAAAGEAREEGRLGGIEAEVVRLSLANLLTFPWIAAPAQAGRLTLQGYLFDVHTGVLASVGPDGVARSSDLGARKIVGRPSNDSDDPGFVKGSAVEEGGGDDLPAAVRTPFRAPTATCSRAAAGARRSSSIPCSTRSTAISS